METRYDFKAIEEKWRKIWENEPINVDDGKKTGFYCLDMFPYPSGKGLHVGHWRGYVLSDVISRYKVLQGHYVLHPMGWDAFGLPAENFAIKNGSHPSITNKENITNIKRQIKQMSAVYDWDKEISTTDPEFYKWTQWIFVQMFKKGLAYEKEMPLNWCPNCKVVLANEEAAGGTCERCKGPTTKKMLRQWMLKITEYADRLLEDLQDLDWPDKVKKMQSDWIGKSYGANVTFLTENNKQIQVFTTRPDTLYGATFIVLAPEHLLVSELTTAENKAEVESYVKAAGTKSSVDRMIAKEKTGAFTGAYAINPLNGEKMPVWVSDYVLIDYGTGAIMCVPAHDERDFEFAKKFELPIIQVIKPENEELSELKEAYVSEGVMVNSQKFDGIKSLNAKEKIADYLEQQGIGGKTISYKLRDWVFSRQRYWGEPIPIIHCDDCGAVAVPEDQLPVMLPDVKSYAPTDTGESPLSKIDEFVNTTCPQCGKPAKRETNTMPQWAGSSWYFLRYTDPKNSEVLASEEALEKLLPVDFYVGGIEHAVLHLLYARFYTKFLNDIGAVRFSEPFTKLFNIGMINKDGRKMDKSGGNGVSPDETVAKYGCDALRMYELFIAPPELDAEWDDSGIEGVFRYVNKLWKFIQNNKDKTVKTTKELERVRHKMIYDITNRLENLSMNTVISGFMEYTNKLMEIAAKSGVDKQTLETIVILLSPFAPHISEELWQVLEHDKSVFFETWPVYDEEKLKDDELTIVVQLNGKVRENITVSAQADKEFVINAAKNAVTARLEGVEIVKEIYVPGKIVNFVLR